MDEKSALDYHITQHGIIQDWIAIKIRDLVSKDATIFDIGANVGLLTLPFAKQLPDGKSNVLIDFGS